MRRGRSARSETGVNWIEDTDTRVDVLKTILEDLAGLLRMRYKRIPRKGS